MICSNCKKEIPEGTKFCENCGTPVNEAQAFIAEEAITLENDVSEESPVVEESAAIEPESTETNEPSDSSVDAILAETSFSHSATAVLDKENGADIYSEPQSAETVRLTGFKKKLNIPASIALCVVFGLLMTAFSAVSLAASSIRKTLVRGAVSEYVDNLYVGDIVIGDTDLANEFVDKSRLSKDSTISDVVVITIEDYEKYIIKGLFENNNVTVEDIDNIEDVDLNAFISKLDGINSLSDLDIQTIIENFEKLDKKEINAIVNEYSKEDFPELTFDIDKRRVEDLLNKSSSPAKSYISNIVKAYENYLLTGEDTKPFTESKMNAFAQDSVNYILDGMDGSYVNEISEEMAQLVTDNRALLNSYNPSSVFGVFGSILPMSFSTGMIFISLGLAVIFAAVTALITKRVDAAAITLGVSLMMAGAAALAVNALPSNFSAITGLDYTIVTNTVTDLLKNTIVEDFSVMGIRSLVLGAVVIAAVVITKIVIRTIKNKKNEE